MATAKVISFIRERNLRRPHLPEFWAHVDQTARILWEQTDDGAYWWSNMALIERMLTPPGVGDKNLGIRLFVERYRNRRALPLVGPPKPGPYGGLLYQYGDGQTVELAQRYVEYLTGRGYTLGATTAECGSPLVLFYQGTAFAGVLSPLGDTSERIRAH